VIVDVVLEAAERASALQGSDEAFARSASLMPLAKSTMTWYQT
jgi:hypothetical protein